MFKVKPRAPVHASSFELEFEDDGEEEDRVIIVRGVLAPLPLTLVPPETDMKIPFVRFLDPSLPTRAAVICDNATFHASEDATGQEGRRLCDVWKPSIGTFSWGDEALSNQDASVVSGPVKVVAQRDIWGVQTVALAFQWPIDAHGINFDIPTKMARVVRATALGRQIARSITEKDGAVHIRLAGGRGVVEVVLEVASADGVALPSFPGATGEIAVELVGPGWDSELRKTLPADVNRDPQRRAQNKPQAHRRHDLHRKLEPCSDYLVHTAYCQRDGIRDQGYRESCGGATVQEPLAPHRVFHNPFQPLPCLRPGVPRAGSSETSQRGPIHRGRTARPESVRIRAYQLSGLGRAREDRALGGQRRAS